MPVDEEGLRWVVLSKNRHGYTKVYATYGTEVEAVGAEANLNRIYGSSLTTKVVSL